MSNFADEDRRVRGRRTIRGMPEDDIPERVTALEAEMGRVREELTTVRADAAAARVLAGGADHDVSEVRGELRAHTRAIGALHEDQVALRQEMRRGFAQVDHRFEQVDQRFEQVDQRFARVDQNFAQVDRNFAEVERQFATVRAGLQQIVGLIERISPE